MSLYCLLFGQIVLCLLKHFEQQILSQPDFESTTRFLKDEIPKRVDHIADKLVAEAMTTAVEQQLSVYDVEYNVLKEAMPDDSAEMGELESKLEMQQHQLKELQKTLERYWAYIKLLVLVSCSVVGYLPNICQRNIMPYHQLRSYSSIASLCVFIFLSKCMRLHVGE